MAKIKRCAGILLLVLLTNSGIGLAQSNDGIVVGGSGIANVVMQALADASGVGDIAIETTGTRRGLEAFCEGEFDLVTASRKMTTVERAACESNEVNRSELLIGHQIAAFVTHPDAPAQCLQFDQLQAALRASASNNVVDWSFYRDDNAELPLEVLLPDARSVEYVIVDGLLAGDGLRLDSEYYDDAALALGRVGQTAGSLAIVPWLEAVANSESPRVLEVGGDGVSGCSLPSAENVETESYDFALSLYAYVNRARLEPSENLAKLLEYLVDESSREVIVAAGATPPSDAVYELNGRILQDADAASQFSGDRNEFRIPLDLSGEIGIVGAASAHSLLSRASEELGAMVTVDFSYAGVPSGLSSLCKGEADIATLVTPTDADAAPDCAEAEVVTLPLTLGAQATVLIGNKADAFSACLSAEQVNEIWRAESAERVERWSDVAEEFPDEAITLFGWSRLDAHTDILLQTAGAIIPAVRRDTEEDFDPQYRAAAVGNVVGALTYLSWADYQAVLEGGQANIHTVAVDAGSGCVVPTRETVENGAYALSRAASLLVNDASLADKAVQTYLWTLFADDSWGLLELEGFVGASPLELPIVRRELLRRFAEAESRYPPDVSESPGASASSDEDADDVGSE